MDGEQIKLNRIIIPGLKEQLATLPTSGKLAISPNGLVYLDIDDNYIHRLFPLLPNKQAVVPEYFGPGGMGAHISVIYPEENVICNNDIFGRIHTFKVGELYSIITNNKKYYALKVEAPSLIEIRREHGLQDELYFKGLNIRLHITIGNVQL